MSQPYEIFGNQNKQDDDGKVIDDFFIETDNAPDLKEATEPIPATTQNNPPEYGRLLTGSMSITLAVFNTPVMVLPADANRKEVTLQVLSSAASPSALVEYVSISDENGKTLGTSGFPLRHGKDPVTITGYTGAIWANPGPAITAAIELSWIAVTA